jgi:hypothetical protein
VGGADNALDKDAGERPQLHAAEAPDYNGALNHARRAARSAGRFSLCSTSSRLSSTSPSCCTAPFSQVSSPILWMDVPAYIEIKKECASARQGAYATRLANQSCAECKRGRKSGAPWLSRARATTSGIMSWLR